MNHKQLCKDLLESNKRDLQLLEQPTLSQRIQHEPHQDYLLD
jgi:hypothetical protein